MGVRIRKAQDPLADAPMGPQDRIVDAGSSPGVHWSGHFTDYSGYAKANREILHRVANVLAVNLLTTGLEEGLIQVDPYTRRKVEAHRKVRINERCPLLRFFGPDYVPREPGHKIIWTMMETTPRVHPQIVSMVNHSYDELWTPTEWNRSVFQNSGVRIPSRVVPLGVNSAIYRPIQGATLPPCRLITTSRAGEVGVPSGFTFVTVGLPSFRKGFDVMAEAFVRAFRGRTDVHMIFAITHSVPEWVKSVHDQFGRHGAMMWTLEGRYTEHEMARIYSASSCYVTASRGEGWNLPICEAAACGVPVIAPDNTSHPEVVGGAAWLFGTEPPSPHPEGRKVSAWYDGMPFSTLGDRSVRHLADLMSFVESGRRGSEVQQRARALMGVMRERWTWDSAAGIVTNRLLEAQP